MQPQNEPLVVLVDANDNPLGTMPKQAAHEAGALHRAVSVFVFNNDGQWLLQQRALHKYHSGGLWTNAACSHPLPNEAPIFAATRRLQEEMGLEMQLLPHSKVLYRSEVGNGLIEHELDHLFIARGQVTPHPNAEEVEAWRWLSTNEIERELLEKEHIYTAWFKLLWRNLSDAI